MLRVILGLAAALSVSAATLLAADNQDKDKKNDQDKDRKKATITKVDPRAGTVTVKMKDKDGKDQEKTFRLTEDVRYLDSTGKAVAVDVFRSGDYILVVEAEGKLKELRQNTPEKATISKVDARDGTVTVKMKDKDGKEHEQTLKTADDARYLDSNGKAVKLDTFHSGDHVRVIEHEGKIKEMCQDRDRSDQKEQKESTEKKDRDRK